MERTKRSTCPSQYNRGACLMFEHSSLHPHPRSASRSANSFTWSVKTSTLAASPFSGSRATSRTNGFVPTGIGCALGAAGPIRRASGAAARSGRTLSGWEKEPGLVRVKDGQGALKRRVRQVIDCTLGATGPMRRAFGGQARSGNSMPAGRTEQG